jgi:hypothetical protein
MTAIWHTFQVAEAASGECRQPEGKENKQKQALFLFVFLFAPITGACQRESCRRRAILAIL